MILNHLLKHIYLTCAFVLAASQLKAQDPYFIAIDRSKGLPSNAVYDIFQDSKGFIWVAHNEGLSRYDGYEFKTYTNSHQTSRSGTNIHEDKYGRIWYENFDGYLYYVQNDTLRSFAQKTALGFIHYGICGNSVIVAQKEGFDIYDGKNLRYQKTIYANADSFGGGYATNEHYYIYSGNALLDIASGGAVSKITTLPTGMITGSRHGALLLPKDPANGFCYDIINAKIEKKFHRPPAAYVQKLAYTGGCYWFCTPQGAWAYDEEGHDLNNGLPFYKSKSISCTFKDREGNQWLGTTNEGILLIPDLSIKIITGLIPNRLIREKDMLHAATRDNAIFTYNFSNNTLTRRFQDSVHHEAIFFYLDSVANKFFLAAQDFKIMDGNFRTLSKNAMAVKDMCRVDDKYYALSTSGTSELIYTGKKSSSIWDSIAYRYKSSNALMAACFVPGTRGRAVTYLPSTHTIYYGTAKGLISVTPSAVREIKYKGQTIYPARLVNYRNVIYIFTTQNDLYKLSASGEITALQPGDAIQKPSNIKVSDALLYLLADNGINVLDTLKDEFVPVNINPAINSNEINDFTTYDGKICIATDKGLLITNRQTKMFKPVPQFMINSISANGTTYIPGSNLEFKYNENDVQINYSILSFKTGGKYPLYYKINSGNWQPASNEIRILKLASLAPGGYNISFRLGGPNDAAVFPVQSVSFSIAKAFWLEWWFFACCLLFVAGCSYSYYRWQTSMLKKKNALLLEKADLEKSLRNSMLTSIRSQMNPHFFYNALNTIQSFIFSDDKRNASTYLVKFSQLTRMILEMSEKDNVSLNEEIKALTFYLELEKMRFHDDFDFCIKINGGVDTDMVKIPPMIVQPYVENAVKHGLLHKKGAKTLSVEFSMEGNNLRIIVDDNGIGRKKAGEINKVRNDKHKSFSTHANNKRIEILNKERSNNIGVTYIDKDEPADGISGTSVTITIPIIFEKA